MNKHIPRKRNLYPVPAENVFSKLPHLWLDHSSKWQQLKTCLFSNLHVPASSLWVLSTFHLPGLRSPADYKVSSYTDICSHISKLTLPFHALPQNPFSPVTTVNPTLPEHSMAEMQVKVPSTKSTKKYQKHTGFFLCVCFFTKIPNMMCSKETWL